MTELQVKTCHLLAKHFGVPAKQIKDEAYQFEKECGGATQVLRFSNELFNMSFAVSKESADLHQIVRAFKIKKTNLFSDMLDMFNNEGVDFVVYLSGKELMAVYEAEQYDGLGAVFCREPDEQKGYVFEPLQHTLVGLFPHRNID